MNVRGFLDEAKSGKVSIEESTYRILEEAEKINKEYNYFNVISKDYALKSAKELDKKLKKGFKGRLAGLPISVKDSICVRGVESSAGSKILKGYVPLFNATAVQKAIDEGAIVIGKTSQDEFGFGGFSTNAGIGFKIPKNPFDKERATGGSSGGCAGFSSITKFPHVSLGESTGGSIVNPAAFCGVSGLSPTYGSVSRYGIIDYGNSLDKIGPIAKTVEDCELMFDVISGYDSKDSTSSKEGLHKDDKIKRVGIIKESLNVDPEVKEVIEKTINNLGFDYEYVSLPVSMNYGIQTYYIIAPSEASTNLAKYCGMRYGAEEELEGNFNEYFTKVRTNNFGKEVKRRILIGTFARMAGFRDAYYLKALKVRTLIIEEYKKAFKKFDVLVSPTVPILPPKFSEINKLSIMQNYMIDVLTVSPNLAGLPHLSINAGFSKKLPVGIMFTANHFEEKKLFTAGKKAESVR
ncbi:Asp-tRNA(Asn)/Glu-tRNA(Gln) amidotransferase subunit GatA [Candidatus Woesearchaeota archaeon]|nr:Asp-tRNA(Asn)/Glu-tRNA(Gln) amidotransferase subunit GatA [Candidatus Woesearchaeota archaeon]